MFKRIVSVLLVLLMLVAFAPSALAGACLDQFYQDVGTCNAAYPSWWQYPLWNICVNSATAAYGLCLLEELIT